MVIAAHAGFASELVALSMWVKQNWTESRPLRIGAIICDTASGWDLLEGVPYLPQGVGFVGYEVLPLLGVIDSTVEQLRLAGKKPDWVLVTHYGGSMATIIKDFARLDLGAKGIKMVVESNSISEAIIDQAGVEDCGGVYFLNFDPFCTETDLPGMKDLIETAVAERGYKADRVPINYVRGWITGAVMTEAVRQAIEKVGFDNLTKAAVRDALFSIKDFDTGLVPPIMISEGKPYYLDSMRIAQVQKGRFVAISDWSECPRANPYEK